MGMSTEGFSGGSILTYPLVVTASLECVVKEVVSPSTRSVLIALLCIGKMRLLSAVVLREDKGRMDSLVTGSAAAPMVPVNP